MTEENSIEALDRFAFKDKAGREWDVTMNLAAARRVDASDFSELTDEKFSILEPDRDFFMKILSDTSLLFGIIWAIVQPQVLEVTEIDPSEDFDGAETNFLEALDGKSIREGRDALWGAIADFFPDQKTALLTLGRQYQKASARVSMELAGMEPEIEEMMNEEITKSVAELKQKLKTPDS